MWPAIHVVATLLSWVHSAQGGLLLPMMIPGAPLASSGASSSFNFSVSLPPATSYSSAFSVSSAAAPTASTTSSRKRAAIPACLKTVELSCLNLAANCIDSVKGGNFNNLWGIPSCVAAATCYGVGDLITSVECQTGFTVTNAAQASLDGSIYAGMVSGCTSCALTQQNYVDFYYGQLSAIGTANWPSSNAIVQAFWSAITAWTATGLSVPYQNFNDWLHYSSYPTIVTTTSTTAVATFTQIPWNPNPAPTSGAISETFVKSTTTVIIAIPKATTTVVVAGTTLTLAPGGTPINVPLPSGVSILSATTPTWNPNIIPPTSVASVTFTAPPSFTTIVAVPTASAAPPKNITGPPGDLNIRGENWWLLVFGPIIGGLLPPDIGIPGGSTPTAAPPADWTGEWSNPEPTSSTSTKSSSASTSTSSSSSCPQPTAVYSLSDDSENADWDGLGADPDRRRSSSTIAARAGRCKPHSHPNPSQHPTMLKAMTLPICQITTGNAIINPNTVSLGGGIYYTIGLKALGGTNTGLSQINVNGRPVGNGGGTVAQEHVFEIGYIKQFFESLNNNGISCTWIVNNVYTRAGWDGRTWALSLLQDIDQTANMVWVDKPMNQAKSNVVNQNKASAADPPQRQNIDKITDFSTPSSVNLIQDAEYFIRNFAALGTYFGSTAATFQATALRIQNRLAQVTPSTPDINLPVAFNSWLRSLVNSYPAGCTSRAANVFNYYRNKMSGVANQHNNGVVPQCFPLFPTGINAQSFAWQNLVPPPPTLPSCNIPGTQGSLQFGINPNGSPENALINFRVLGAGRSDLYSFGTGSDYSDPHFVAADISSIAGCGGAVNIGPSPPGTAYPDAFLSPQCNGQTGKRTVPVSFVVNGQSLSCVSLYSNVPASGGGIGIFILCAGSTAAATSCATSVMTSNYPTGHLLAGPLLFIPS
ncbi:chitin synthase [Favolaschia claudopus]|uniref:Chitin synthase n=1 Tax=Favolaschia claudopus TaxID=2862362 RepID=A0AAW0AMD2_9AGAR